LPSEAQLNLIPTIPVNIYVMLLIFMLPYSYLCYFLVYGAIKYKVKKTDKLKEHPIVTVQLPIYNEKLVFSRLIKSVCELNWPISALEILVLDDSSDDTSELIDSEIKEYRSRGFKIEVVRRKERTGFKAGAMQNALGHSHGECIAIFDADCIPQPDFLLKTIPYLEENPRLGFVQARLGHVNRNFNKISETVAIALDCHYLVEKTGRYSISLATNFDGSAGVIRKRAIYDLGGWNHETLTEDMDLSYKMRINGWESLYLRDVVVESEVPITLSDFKSQQARWASGCVQTARELLRRIWLSKNFSFLQKIESTIHLTNFFVFPAILLSFVSLVVIVVMGYDPQRIFYSVLGVTSSVGSLGVSIMYFSSVKFQKIRLRDKIPYLGLLGAIGVGLSAHYTISIFKSLLNKKNKFVPTPKYNLNNNDRPSTLKVRNSKRSWPYIEFALVIISIIGILSAVINYNYVAITSLFVYFICYSLITYYTINDSVYFKGKYYD